MTCIFISAMSLFAVFISICFFLHCVFWSAALNTPKKIGDFIEDKFNNLPNKIQLPIMCMLIIGSIIFMFVGIVILVSMISYYWYLIAAYLPCIVIV